MATVKAIFQNSAMGLAYDKLANEIGLADDFESLNRIAAQKIIDAARSGERDPEKLCAAATDALIGKE